MMKEEELNSETTIPIVLSNAIDEDAKGVKSSEEQSSQRHYQNLNNKESKDVDSKIVKSTTNTIANHHHHNLGPNPLMIENKELERKPKPLPKVFKSFEERLEELKSYKSQYGHCRVPSKYENNPSMAAWCANLKQSYRLLQQGKKPILKLSEDKIDALEDTGFEWKYSGRNQKSSNNSSFHSQSSSSLRTGPDEVNRISESIQQNDNTDVKIQISNSSSPSIPLCLIKSDPQKQERMNSSTEETIDISLEGKIGTSTKGSKRTIDTTQSHSLRKRTRKERTRTKSFDERLEELKLYKVKHGHCRVSRNDSSYYSLGSWCHNIRGSYRANRKQDNDGDTILPKNKIDALDKVGFDWTLKEPRQMKSFHDRLQDLREFKELFGHTRVPSGYEKNPSLAYWCNNLRNAYKMKKTGKKQFISLSRERLDALEEIGFEFSKKQRKSVDELSVEEDEELIGLEGGVGPILFV